MNFAGPHTLDVWLEDRLAGQLMRAENGDVEFAYTEAHLATPQSTPLSVSMPLTSRGHGPDRVMPWLSNLLPDEDQVRDRWAAKFNSRDRSPFGLLRHMGQDAPGAVQVVPHGVVPNTAGELTAISEQEIASRIAGIITDPDHWVDDSNEDDSRFSLAGTQGKFALARIGESWYEPNGRAPSTHIVKPGMRLASGATNAEAMAVEFVTMRTARDVGIPTATAEIIDFAGTPAFVSTRFDRVARADETGSAPPTRIHQEDFCQALSLYPGRKYESDGGPSMADMHALVAQLSTAAPGVDVATLADLFAFNLLIAGVDAHAKNHSFLLRGNQVRLAPAYDLISAHGLWPEARVRHKSHAAVKYGKTRSYASISGRNLARTADVLGEPRQRFRDRLRGMIAPLADAMQRSIGQLPASLRSEFVTQMPDRQARFAGHLSRAIREMDLDYRELPRFQPELANPLRRPTAVWEPGHYDGDRWISGRYVRVARRGATTRL